MVTALEKVGLVAEADHTTVLPGLLMVNVVIWVLAPANVTVTAELFALLTVAVKLVAPAAALLTQAMTLPLLRRQITLFTVIWSPATKGCASCPGTRFTMLVSVSVILPLATEAPLIVQVFRSVTEMRSAVKVPVGEPNTVPLVS